MSAAVVSSGDSAEVLEATKHTLDGIALPVEDERKADLPKKVEHWSLTALREKLVKIGAKVVSHGRYVTFLLAEVAIPKSLFGRDPAPD